MTENFRKRVGDLNVVGIGVLAAVVFFLSVIFLGGKAEGERIKAHWFYFSLRHIGGLMLIALVVTLGFMLLTLVYEGVFYRRINGRRLLTILTGSLLASFIAAFVGNLLLLL